PSLPEEQPLLPPADPGVAALPPTLPLEGDSQPSLPPTTQAPVVPKTTQAQAPQRLSTRSSKAEDAQYKSALRAAQSGKSQEGIQKFRQLLQQYPNGKYAANAEFWIGECLYNQGKYQEALGQFKTVNSKYPNHHKNADALLKAGMTYKRLGDQENARANYQQLQQQFPKSEAARRARSGR
ncbi:MAG: tol-pal system protein YbgF, partial [Desulfovibrionaceae bacterium]|nr:tol-pal system protein YbgF [Desulfovibrionaceae bacterium]